jgi:hypothetical protein
MIEFVLMIGAWLEKVGLHPHMANEHRNMGLEHIPKHTIVTTLDEAQSEEKENMMLPTTEGSQIDSM